MRNIDKIREKLKTTKITSRYEALYNYGIPYKEIVDEKSKDSQGDSND